MDRSGSEIVAGPLRTLCESGPVGGLGDSELLDRFAAGPGEGSEIAFAALVERHGPLVRHACRSLLRDPAEADDAFQATFLVLARRAPALWVRGSLAPWLLSVAHRVPAGRKSADARRRGLERRLAERLEGADRPSRRDDLAEALLEEVERLPERLRGPLVLCHLEGLTHDEAAARLACPVGTVRSRLSRARDRLRDRLARRGFAPAGPKSPASPLPRLALPPVPAPLALATARLALASRPAGLLAGIAARLTEGGIVSMTWKPASLLVLTLVAAGSIAAGHRKSPAQEAPGKPADASRFSTLEERNHVLEIRLRDLERRLDAVESRAPAGPKPAHAAIITRVRSRLPRTLVEKVLVDSGASVRKGDPLIRVSSPELAQTKVDFMIRFVQWDHDRKYLVAREPLAREGRITPIVWADTQNDEKKSRLDFLIARHRLFSYGLEEAEIDGLVKRLADGPGLGGVDTPGEIRSLGTMDILAPVDARVTTVDASPGDFHDPEHVLMTLSSPKP